MTTLQPGLALPGDWVLIENSPSALRLEVPAKHDRAMWKRAVGTTLGSTITAAALFLHSFLNPELTLIELPVGLLFALVAGFGVKSIRATSLAARLPLLLEVRDGVVRGALTISRARVEAPADAVRAVRVEPVSGVAAVGRQLQLLLADGRTLGGPLVYVESDAAGLSQLELLAAEFSKRTGARTR